MAIGNALEEKLHAGNPHVRFDEGEVASAATPRRRSLLYKMGKMIMNGESNARNSHVWFGDRETAFEHRNGTHFYKAAKNLALAILTLIGSTVVNAEEITLEQAETAVQVWIDQGYSMGKLSRRTVIGSETLVDPVSGAELRVVKFEGGGFVVTSSDDLVDPVIAFSERGNGIDSSSGNPFWMLLRGDIAAREAAAGVSRRDRRAALRAAPVKGSENSGATRTEAQHKWDELLGRTSESSVRVKALKATRSSVVSDIRVDSFLKSKWSQSEVNKEYCWNYYTPGETKRTAQTQTKTSMTYSPFPADNQDEESDHYPCGCTATAIGQIMRYYKWPKKSISAQEYPCETNGVPVLMAMFGGSYDWDNMPLNPYHGVLTDTQRRAIGKLVYDIGVSREMNWGRGESSASLIGGGEHTFKSDYKYAHAVDLAYQDSYYPWSLDEFKKAVIPNLDARCPVGLSIHRYDNGKKKGHAVVADGYGYSAGSLAIHVNMGWGDNSDAWYSPPQEIHNYTAIDGLVCNIFPEKTGNILSGRVTMSDGTPVSGATIALLVGTTELDRTQTDGNGIYAFISSRTGTFTIRATAAGQSASTVGTLSSTIPLEVSRDGSYSSTSCAIGNSYDNNITLPTVAQTSTILFDFQGGANGTTTVNATLGAAMPEIICPVRTGYAFDGYYNELDGKGRDYYDAEGHGLSVWNQVEGQATLYANWEPVQSQLVFSWEGEDKLWSYTTKAKFGEVVELNVNWNDDGGRTKVPIRTGYMFGGFWTEPNGVGIQYFDEELKQLRAWDRVEDTTLYGKWTGNSYVVTLDKQGGENGSSSVTATYGSVLPTVTPPVLSGWNFCGYFAQRGGSGKCYILANGKGTAAWDILNDTTLYAYWEKAGAASHDSLSNARVVSGSSGSSTFSNVGYSNEPNEPTHSSGNYQGGASVWASWTAPASGDWTIWLTGTHAESGGELDTQLAVYTGTAMEELSLVAANDDTPAGGYSSRLSFHATAGVEYKIAMDTYCGAAGSMVLSWNTGFVHYVTLEQENMFAPVSTHDASISITSSTEWMVVDHSDWIVPKTFSGNSGSELVFTIVGNTTGSERLGYISIKAGNSDESKLTVRQNSVEFVTTRDEAVEEAWRDNKRILLVRGRETCGNTRATLFSTMPSTSIRSLVENGYVLWYSNCDRQTDASMYASGLGSYTLPLVCILDPKDMSAYVARTTGYQSTSALKSLLDANSSWSGLPSPTGAELTGVGAALSSTPYSMSATFADGTSLDLKHGVTWTIASGSAATISDTGILTPVAGRTGTVTVRGSVTLRGQVYTRTMDVRVIDPAKVTSVSVSGPDVIDLYDVDSGRFVATVTCSDGTTAVVSPQWTIEETAVTNAVISAEGLVTFPNPEKYNKASRLRVTAECNGVVASKEAAVWGWSVSLTSWTTPQRVVWPGQSAKIVPNTVTWWRHGVTEAPTADFDGVDFSIGYGYVNDNTYVGSDNATSAVDGPALRIPSGTSGQEGYCYVYVKTSATRFGQTITKGSWQYFKYLPSVPSQTVTVTFVANGGEPETHTSKYAVGYTYGYLPEAIRTGYSCDWYTAAEGGTKVTTASNSVASVTRLYAHWSPRYYYLTFDANGGEGEMYGQYLYYDTPATIRARTFKREGYSFEGWALSPDGPVAYQDGEEVLNLRDSYDAITLYAVWRDLGIASPVTGLTVSGPGLIDLYDKSGGQYVATVTCSDGTTVEVEPEWSVEGVSVNYAQMSRGGELSFYYDTYTVYQCATATVTAAYGGFTATTQTVLYGPGYVSIDKCAVPQNAVWPGCTFSVVPQSVKWWRHGVLEEATSDLSDVAFTWDLSCPGDKSRSGDGSSFTVPSDAFSTNDTCTVVVYSKPDRERYYSSNGRWFYPQFYDSRPQMVTVTFDANGGDASFTSMNCAAGKPYGSGFLPTLTRRGYYGNWYTAREGGTRVVATNDVPAVNTTLYAHWDPNYYYLTFDANGGEGEMYGQYLYYDIPATIRARTFKREGYSFEGWALSPDGPVAYQDGEEVLNMRDSYDAITLYAKWKDVGCVTVMFFPNSGSGIMETQTFTQGEKQSLTRNAFMREGYSFEGWATSPDGDVVYLDGQNITVSTDVSLYAVWKATFGIMAYASPWTAKDAALKEGKLLFVLSGADWCGFCTIVKEYLMGLGDSFWDKFVVYYCNIDTDTYDMANGSPAYGVFDPKLFNCNWTAGRLSFNSGGVEQRVQAVIDEALEKYDLTTYKVTFDVNCANVTEPAARTLAEGVVVGNLPSLTRDGYTFTGWWTKKSGGIQVTAATKVTADVTFYAHWTANTYTVSFNANGGSLGTASSTVVVTYDAAYGDLPSPTMSGYTFDGWFTEASGGTQVTATTKVAITAAQTLYAHWTVVPAVATYTVTYSPGAYGAGTQQTDTKTYGVALALKGVVFTRTGYTQTGWSTNYFGNTSDYPLNGSYTANVAVGLYPYWMANGGGSGGGDTPTTTYTVTLNANGGNVSSTTWTMTSGAAVGTLPTPTWDGYAFGGWFTAASGGTQVSASTIVAGDVTYYAHWTEIPPPPPPDSGELDVAFAKAQTANGALYRGDALVGTVQVKVGKINKRGVVKVSATATMLIDGKAKKVTAKAVNVMLDATGRVPPVNVVFKAPIGEMAFEMAADGSFTLKNGSYLMAEATIGGALKGGSHGTFRMDGFDLAVPGELLDDLLPNEESFSVSNGKWAFAKAATVKWAKDRVTKEYGLVVDNTKGKTNLSGLKLTYAAKTGQFKGSFKAYALEEKNGKTKLVKYTVNVIGFVVDGVGYGEASCKKPAATWSVTVK